MLSSTYSEELLNIFRDQDFITSDGILRFARTNNLLYVKRDFLFRPGRWRNDLVLPPYFEIISHNKLLLGHSDLTTTARHLRLLRLFNPVLAVFGMNMVQLNEHDCQLPLGLTNNTNETIRHKIFGDQEILVRELSRREVRDHFDGSIYVCVSLNNNLATRAKLIQAIRLNPQCVIEEPAFTTEGRARYLRNLSTYSVVPCPEGNGPDTHRLWETLYMGGIPAILKSEFLYPLTKSLPVIQLRSWSQLNDSDFLESNWYSAKQRLNPKHLRLSYWTSLISDWKSAQ
jgi:hypothetical protein